MVQEGVDLKTIQWSQHWSVKSSSVDLNMENFLLGLNVFWETKLCNTTVFFMITIVAERMAAYESSIKKKPSFVLDVGNVNIMDKKVNTNQQVCLKMIRTLLTGLK